MSWAAVRATAVLLACLLLLVILLIVAVVFVGLHRMTEYNALYATVRAPRIKMSDAYAGLRTGDLLLFVATTASPSNSFLTQMFYTHAGVLLRQGELVYISESQPGLEIMPDPRRPGGDVWMARGAVITPLLTRLKYYTGDCYLVRLSRQLSPGQEEALKLEAERLRLEKYPYPNLAQVFMGIAGWKTATRHCFQHAAHMLDVAGLTSREEPLADASFIDVCRGVCDLPGRPLAGGVTYRPPLQLIYDIGTVAS